MDAVSLIDSVVVPAFVCSAIGGGEKYIKVLVRKNHIKDKNFICCYSILL